MDIYILNGAYGKILLLEKYDSFIWKEKHVGHDDFQLVVRDTAVMRNQMRRGYMITHSETNRVCRISYRDIDDDAGTITVSGKSITDYFDSRALKPNVTGKLEWRKNDSPANIIASLVNEICVVGSHLSPLDIIPELYVANVASPAATTNFSTSVTSNLTTVLNELCAYDNNGYAIELLPNSPKLRFVVSSGTDQSGVIFSSTLDSLYEEKYFYRDEQYRNIAYVYGTDSATFEIVPRSGVEETISGVDRRVLLVDASDVDRANTGGIDYRDILRSRGRQALAEHSRINYFDGLVPAKSPYKYGINYRLGDIVRMMDDDGRLQRARVTEYIFSSDSTGDKGYPTLAVSE